jgi:large subunit ribosomal protein L4
MTSVLVKDLKGKEVGKKELAAEVFGIEPNLHLVHSALIRQLANARHGSANTKTRSEVRGGGKKPWRQKGTGRARAGSIRSPLWNGGGVIFGPKPRDYSISMPKKARQAALKSALAARANELVIVQSFDGLFNSAPKAGEEVKEQPKTKSVYEALKALGIADKVVLIVVDSMVAGAAQVQKAARNIRNVKVVDMSNLNVKDLAHCEALLTTEQVLAELENRFKNCGGNGHCSEHAIDNKTVEIKKPAVDVKPKAAKAAAEEKPAAKKATTSKKSAPEEAEEKPAPKKTSKKKSEEA